MNEELPQYNPRLTTIDNFKRAFQEGRTQTLKNVKKKIIELQLGDADGCECPSCCFAIELLSKLEDDEVKK